MLKFDVGGGGGGGGGGGAGGTIVDGGAGVEPTPLPPLPHADNASAKTMDVPIAMFRPVLALESVAAISLPDMPLVILPRQRLRQY